MARNDLSTEYLIIDTNQNHYRVKSMYYKIEGTHIFYDITDGVLEIIASVPLNYMVMMQQKE